MIETYTDKHKALAKHLSYLHIEDIDNEDDVEFNGYDACYWVMTTEEAMDIVYDEVYRMLESEEHSFPIRYVIDVLNIEEDELKLFYLADVLTGELTVGKEIGGETLSKFVESVSDKDKFSNDYTFYLFNHNRSGTILDSRMKSVEVDGFHIYER